MSTAIEWRAVTLGELLRTPARTGLSRPGGPDSDKSCLTLSAVRGRVLDLSACKPATVSDAEAEGNWVQRGRFYVVRGNGNRELVGRGAFAPDPLPCRVLFPDLLFQLDLNDGVNRPFFWFLWASPAVRKEIEARSRTAAGIYKINTANLLSVPLRLPPLMEQERIAARLTEQLAVVDHARTAAQARVEAAEAMPAAYLREVFRSSEAAMWSVLPVRDFAAVSGGVQKSPGRSALSFHRPYLTVRNVQRGSLDLTHVDRFEVTPAELERLRLCRGDILIVEGNGSPDQIGRNAIFDLDGEWVHQNHVIRVRLTDSADCHYVSKYLNSDAGRGQMLERARSTSGLYTLSVDKINSLEIPLPPVAEQRRIAAGLSGRLAEAERLIGAARAELAAVDALPAAVLRDAFSGGV